MQIDCYGFEATSQWFKRRSLKPHLIKESDGVLYISFGYSPHGPIHRIDRDPDGNLRLMWAFGAFADAASLAYVPINDTLEIKEDLWK